MTSRARLRLWPMIVVITGCALLAGTMSAHAAPTYGPDPESISSLNPVGMLENASESIPGFNGGLTGALNVLILLTVLTVAPSILIMCTCFTRFVIVLSLLRQALGTATLPPSQVIVGMSLLMTILVMEPTFTRIYDEAIVPYQQGDPSMQSQLDVWNRARIPLRDFMFNQIEKTDNWDAVYMILDYRGLDTTDPSALTYDDVDMLTLIPAFIMGELKVGFLVGFRVYLPFLIVDMVIASLLISMGMLMLPPVLISLPFKLLLFVLVDGWMLVVGNLLTTTTPQRIALLDIWPPSIGPPGQLAHTLLLAVGLT